VEFGKIILPLMESLDSLDLGLDFDAFSLPPPPEELSSLFLGDEGIDTIDEAWWQEIALASPDEGIVDETRSGDSPVGVGVGGVVDGDGAGAAPSSSGSSPTPTLTSEHEAVAVPSESGTKRSAASSPEYEDDDPKRARRLEKNREAASQSRARKKSYVKELEVKCRMLEAHVAQLQRVMTVTSMENSALKDELVRVKKPMDGVKTGVAEPAVLESNSLPSEFLRHHSCRYPMGQQVTSPTAGRFPKFLLTLLELLILAAVSGLSGPQTTNLSLPLREGMSSFPIGIETFHAFQGGMVGGRNSRKRKKSRRQYDLNFRSSNRPPGIKRRKVKRIRSRRVL